METLDDEPDDRFYETSYSLDGIYDQFVLFVMENAEIIYNPELKGRYYCPEVAYPGKW